MLTIPPLSQRLNMLGLFAVSAVLAVAFAYQLVWNEVKPSSIQPSFHSLLARIPMR